MQQMLRNSKNTIMKNMNIYTKPFIFKQRFMISEYLNSLNEDQYLSIYLKSIEFDGLQGQSISDNLFLYGIGQSGYEDQPSRFQEVSSIILDQDQSQIVLLNIDPTLYLDNKQPDIHNLTINIKQLDNVDNQQDFQISNYYRIPMINENQLFTKTETINKIITSCNQIVLDPFQDKYYFFFPILVLNILKKSEIILSQSQKLYQIYDCLQTYTHQSIKSKFDDILNKLQNHNLQSIINLSESFQVFEPELTLNYQLEHILLLYKIIKYRKQKMSLYLNQYQYTLLKNYFNKMYIDKYESIEQLEQEYEQRINKKVVIDSDEQLQSIALLQIIFDCDISEQLQIDNQQKEYLLVEYNRILETLHNKGFIM